jgi:hypothetical protein
MKQLSVPMLLQTLISLMIYSRRSIFSTVMSFGALQFPPALGSVWEPSIFVIIDFTRQHLRVLEDLGPGPGPGPGPSQILPKNLGKCDVRRLLVAASVVPSSPIHVNLMKEALGSSETSVLTSVTRRNIPQDTILHSVTCLVECRRCYDTES